MSSFKRPNDTVKLHDDTSKHLIPNKETVDQSSDDCKENSNKKFLKANKFFEKKNFIYGILSIIFLLIIFIGLALFVLVETKKKIRLLENVEENRNRCLTVNCYQMSNFMLDNLNQTGNLMLTLILI